MDRRRNLPDSLLPAFTADDLRTKVRQYDRTPFLDLVAAWLECSPDPEAVLAFANKKPDAWAVALTNLGKLAGFTEKREVEWTGTLKVSDMSDSQLEDLFVTRAAAMGLPTLELEAIRKPKLGAAGDRAEKSTD